jgi:hypothetical protein
MPLNEEGFITRVALRHSVSPDAVRTILRALRSGGGTMAQFSWWHVPMVAGDDHGWRDVQ